MPIFFKSTNFFKPLSRVISNAVTSPIHTRKTHSKVKPRTLKGKVTSLAKPQENFKGRKSKLPKIRTSQTVRARVVAALKQAAEFRSRKTPRPYNKARTNKLKKSKTYMALLNRHGLRRRAVL